MTTPQQSYREILLTQDQITRVDSEDYLRSVQFKWHAQWIERAQCFYACRAVRDEFGKQQSLPLAHFIMGLEWSDPRIVDHISRDTLDNRKANLRVGNQTLNIANQRIRKDNTSGYKGVSRHSQSPLWRVGIRAYGKLYHLGVFPLDKLEEAARAYDKAALHHFGEFAVLNFPNH